MHPTLDRNAAAVTGGRHINALFVFAPTIFLSAWLLFLIQPMFGKMALPLLGGAPAVWNTAMVFFQGALLGGYLYAHLLGKCLPVRHQVAVHGLLLTAAFLVLPVAVGSQWQNPPAAAPAGWLLLLLAANIGLPFFAISANAPLLQHWFAQTGHADADDPYFLYGASNLGSILALLLYPLLIEVSFDLPGQGWLWTASYGLLALMIVGCGGLARASASTDAPRRRHAAAGKPIFWRTRLHWAALAFAPSGLLLSVTAYITTDLVALPLLWIAPLTLFLLTFVLVFARRPLIPHRWMCRAQVPLLLLAAAGVFLTLKSAAYLQMGMVLAAFFVTAMVCHGELARRRPDAAQLTEFYLWMSLGGIAGGAFTALAAPLLFDRILEYPLLILAAALLRPRGEPDRPNRWLAQFGTLRLWDLALPAICLAPALLIDWTGNLSDVESLALKIAVVLIVLTAVSATTRPLRLALILGVTVLLSAGGDRATSGRDDVFAGRSFFGAYRLAVTQDGRHTLLIHGSTVHGATARRADAGLPSRHTYYHATTGVGRVFARIAAAGLPVRRVAAVGLGAGEIACYRQPGQTWTFYEIDPLMVRIARDPKLFPFLSRCAPGSKVVVGDGRLTLARRTGTVDLLVLDAFSSDAIPAHLLTVEAFRTYRAKLAPKGLLLVHISNRHLDMEPVLAAVTRHIGLSARLLHSEVPRSERKRYRFDAIWVAIARDDTALAPYIGGAGWRPLRHRPGLRPWTDAYSNIVSILK